MLFFISESPHNMEVPGSFHSKYSSEYLKQLSVVVLFAKVSVNQGKPERIWWLVMQSEQWIITLLYG